MIVSSIWKQLEDFVEQNNAPCIPFCSPLDVQLCKDDKNMIQPDVLILCKPEQLLKNGRVEVLSPSNRKHDLCRKLGLYAGAGVREYWIVDPKDRKICVYDFESGIMPKLYEFTDQIPVGIWDNKCLVDFQRISDKLARIPEE